MKLRFFLKPLTFLLLFISPVANVRSSAGTYTLVVTHAKIHGSSGADQDAVAISGDQISALGSTAELTSRCSSPCQIVDAGGGYLIPGFHDAHAHQISGGSNFYKLNVSGSSVSSIAESVRQFAKTHPESAWITGRGWNASGFGSHFPTRQDLDRAEAAKPVVLLDSDGHQLWVNSAAMRAAKITRETSDPAGGTIVRDAQGEPTGIFLENAADLIYAAEPDPTAEERQLWILKGDELGVQSGFTSTQGGPVALASMQAYRALDEQGKLKQRVFLWGALDSEDVDFNKIVDFDRSLPKNGKVKITAFKGFVDGVISSYTGALLDDYADRPGVRGEPTMKQVDLDRWVLRANRAGYPVALHSIGDRAVRMSLDAFENSKKILGHKLINRIEHIEVVNPADAPRFGTIGVAASMQPAHMYFGSAGSSYYPTRLGTNRLQHAFAWNELQKGGALLLFGTDYPVVDQDPIEAMYCAVNRLYRNGVPFEPAQRVAADQAFQALTTNTAKAIGLESTLGQIKPGFLADLLIFGQDPRTGKERSLDGNPVNAMIVGGRLVSQATR